MNRNSYHTLRFPLYRPLTVVAGSMPSLAIEFIEFVRGQEYIAMINPVTNKPVADGAVLLDLWTCCGCGEQYPDHDRVEEFMALHAKKHGLVRYDREQEQQKRGFR